MKRNDWAVKSSCIVFDLPVIAGYSRVAKILDTIYKQLWCPSSKYDRDEIIWITTNTLEHCINAHFGNKTMLFLCRQAPTKLFTNWIDGGTLYVQIANASGIASFLFAATPCLIFITTASESESGHVVLGLQIVHLLEFTGVKLIDFCCRRREMGFSIRNWNRIL